MSAWRRGSRRVRGWRVGTAGGGAGARQDGERRRSAGRGRVLSPVPPPRPCRRRRRRLATASSSAFCRSSRSSRSSSTPLAPAREELPASSTAAALSLCSPAARRPRRRPRRPLGRCLGSRVSHRPLGRASLRCREYRGLRTGDRAPVGRSRARAHVVARAVAASTHMACRRPRTAAPWHTRPLFCASAGRSGRRR